MKSEVELIIEYLDGKLEGDELGAFEKKLQSDASFSEEVNTMREIRQAVTTAGKIHLKERLRQMDREVDQGVNIKKISMYKYWIAAAAVLLIILVPAAYMLFLYESTSQRLFSEHFAAYANVISRRADANERLQLAMSKYEAEAYGDALVIFKEMVAIQPDDIPIQFYTGVVYLCLADPENALSHFKIVIRQENNMLIEPATWYLGLAYLKNEDIQNAKKFFEMTASKDTNYMSSAAKEILRSLD